MNNRKLLLVLSVIYFYFPQLTLSNTTECVPYAFFHDWFVNKARDIDIKHPSDNSCSILPFGNIPQKYYLIVSDDSFQEPTDNMVLKLYKKANKHYACELIDTSNENAVKCLTCSLSFITLLSVTLLSFFGTFYSLMLIFILS